MAHTSTFSNSPTGLSDSLATPNEIGQWLQHGIAAAKAGQLEDARFQLLDVVEQDQTNETAWYWLYQVYDRVDDKRICLENLILINPNNVWAKQELLKLLELSAYPQTQSGYMPGATATPQRKKTRQKTTQQEVSRPVTLKLVTAFWFGISIIILGGGIISALQGLVYRVTNQGYATPLPITNIALGMFFVITGVLGLCVAVALYFQSMVGFYGSLLLAMGLLLIGPTFSLIVNPPNYVAMTCMGGIAGVIVLLTLASQPGFKDAS